MKQVLLLLLAGWMTGSAFAQQDSYSQYRELRGNGKLIREEFTPAPYQAIAVGPFLANVLIEVGGAQSLVSVDIDSNLKSFLQVTSVDGLLTLALTDPDHNPFWLGAGTIRVRVRTPVLTQLRNESNGDVAVNHLTGPSFALVHKGNGRVTLQGAVDQLSIISAANGDIKAKDLVVKTASVVTQANATVDLNAKQVQSVNSGNASIRNVGKATAQRPSQLPESTATKQVTVLLLNDALNARTVTLRFAEPGNPIYGVISTTLGPNAKRRETYPVGTKIEQLDSQQQRLAMTGAEVTGKLIVTLKTSDNGRTYKLLD